MPVEPAADLTLGQKARSGYVLETLAEDAISLARTGGPGYVALPIGCGDLSANAPGAITVIRSS